MRNIDDVTDDELEECYVGTTDTKMVRRLIRECVMDTGYIDEEAFGASFARQIEDFISADFSTGEWDEAWEANREWGVTIAENINDMLDSEEDE